MVTLTWPVKVLDDTMEILFYKLFVQYHHAPNVSDTNSDLLPTQLLHSAY